MPRWFFSNNLCFSQSMSHSGSPYSMYGSDLWGGWLLPYLDLHNVLAESSSLSLMDIRTSEILYIRCKSSQYYDICIISFWVNLLAIMYGIRHLYLAVASLAAIVSSTAVNLSKRDTPLSITLSEAGNAVVKATITNTGNTSLTLLNAGTILDSSAAVKKVDVFSGSKYSPKIKAQIVTLL